jgi:nucleotide-binding universal stress UspA family protein
MFRRLVVPLDTSPLSEQAAYKAAAIARSTRATLHLVHVYAPRLPAFDGGAVIDEQILALDRKQYERHLTRVAAELTKRFGCKTQVAMLSGVPAREIAKYARQQGADLIVASTHGRTGVSRAWFGSVADSLAREAAIPVLMVRPQDGETIKQKADAPPFERILIALDGSDQSESVLADLRALKTSDRARHLLVEVVNPVALPILDYPDGGIVMPMAQDQGATELEVARATSYLAGIAHRLEREGAADVDPVVHVAAAAAPAIVELARMFDADLVVMTSHGRGASRLLLGSVADKILRGTHCSILLRRTPMTAKKPVRRAAAGKRPATSK